MKTIRVSDLKPGMMYDQPVFVDDDNFFVPAEIPIKKSDIDRLMKWGVAEVRTDGKAISAGTAASGTLGGLNAQDGDDKLLKVYVVSVLKMDKIFDAIKNNQDVDIGNLDKIVRSMLSFLKDYTYELIAFTIRNESAETSFGKGAVNCLILSVVIGMQIGLPEDELRDLAFGALLHDIGMVKIPDYVLNKETDLSPEDVKRIHTHPLYSYQFITKSMKLSEKIGVIALQHQERWDGKGYPRKLAGKDIALPARILAIADSFEAMIGDRPYRNSMIGYSAMRQILNEADRRFDSEILKVFIKSMGIYPLGSMVLLNDGSIGRVVEIHNSAPLRPCIKIIVGSDGQKYVKNEGKDIDLLHDTSLFIAKAINPKNIRSAGR